MALRPDCVDPDCLEEVRGFGEVEGSGESY